jgi:hypothetical protein
MQRIGTMGHSRGGEGVVRHFILNQSLVLPSASRQCSPSRRSTSAPRNQQRADRRSSALL